MMRKIHVLVAILVASFHLSVLGQDDGKYCQKPSKKALKYYEQAERMRFKGSDSYLLLKKAIAADEEFAEAYLALAHFNEDQYNITLNSRGPESKGTLNFERRMIEYYQLAMEYCPEINNAYPNFLLGEHFFSKRDYATAKPYLEAYLELSKGKPNTEPRLKSEAYLATIKSYFDIVSNPVPFSPVKVRGASTEHDEYLPMLSPDNRFLFFTRKQPIQFRNSVVGAEVREIFTRSHNNYNGSFETGAPMPQPFNMDKQQGGSSISVDNKLLFVTVIEYVQQGQYVYPMGDIYYSEFVNNEWTTLKSAGPEINNRAYWEGQPSISSDNNTLYFVRAIYDVIPGEHYGLMDIYKSERQPDGSWGKAINLGPKINTGGNEKSPFMHSDSYTLYFSSDKPGGVGGFDIYYSKMEPDGTFQQIKNLGYPINTDSDEHGFIVSTDGKSGYFSSSMEENGLDIYSFELYKEARPEKVIFVKGEAISGKEALDGLEIKLKNVVTDKEVEVVLDKNTGEYVGVIAVKDDEDVLMTAKKDGYAFSSQYISSDENVVGKPVKADMEVKKIKKGETYKINNIVFQTNSSELDKRVKAILDEFGDFLKRNPNLRVELHGHTDNVGNAEENRKLSEDRAKSVFEYLVSTGVEKNRLSYKGYGSTKPIADNGSQEGRALNRRTEFLVVSE